MGGQYSNFTTTSLAIHSDSPSSCPRSDILNTAKIQNQTKTQSPPHSEKLRISLVQISFSLIDRRERRRRRENVRIRSLNVQRRWRVLGSDREGTQSWASHRLWLQQLVPVRKPRRHQDAPLRHRVRPLPPKRCVFLSIWVFFFFLFWENYAFDC